MGSQRRLLFIFAYCCMDKVPTARTRVPRDELKRCTSFGDATITLSQGAVHDGIQVLSVAISTSGFLQYFKKWECTTLERRCGWGI